MRRRKHQANPRGAVIGTSTSNSLHLPSLFLFVIHFPPDAISARNYLTISLRCSRLYLGFLHRISTPLSHPSLSPFFNLPLPLSLFSPVHQPRKTLYQLKDYIFFFLRLQRKLDPLKLLNCDCRHYSNEHGSGGWILSYTRLIASSSRVAVFKWRY